MIIKKYLVNDMFEAVRRAKEELGDDAIIVTQRKVRSQGLGGVFKPRKLEVTMAVESDDKPGRPPKKKKKPRLPAYTREGAIQGLDEEVTAYLMDKLEGQEAYQNYCQTEDKDETMVPVFIGHYLQEALSKIDYQTFIKERCVAFVGSTGVGKTTTIAKIAALARSRYHKKVGLITIDTYRIGAVEQLKIYGEIMDLQMEKVMEPEEMSQALDRLKDCQLILIDTLGTSYRNQEQLDIIDGYLQAEKSDTHIHRVAVFNATLDLGVFEKTLHTYESYPMDYLIFTKIDEMDNPFRLLEYLERTQTPLAYVSTGQAVPDDLIEADENTLYDYLLKGEKGS